MAAILDSSFGGEIYPLSGLKYEEHSWAKRVEEESYLIICPYCGSFVTDIFNSHFDCYSCGKMGFNNSLVIMDREAFLKEIMSYEKEN